MKHLHSIELIKEPSLPSVCESQKERLRKVVKYYFPGETSKIMLGSANSMLEEARLAISLNDVIVASIGSLTCKSKLCSRKATSSSHFFSAILTIDYCSFSLVRNALGATIREVVSELQSQGYFETEVEVRRALSYLCNEPDEEHFAVLID